MPRRMPGWHGGAVPARPAMATWGGLHRSTTGSTALGASTGDAHTPGLPQTRTTSTERRSGGVWARRRQEPVRTWAEIDPRSHRRGKDFQIHLVEEEEGRGAHRLPSCRQRKSPEMAGICRRRRQRRHWSQEGAREKKRGEWARQSGLGQFDWPRPESFGLA
jgi:hypothetical protein